MLNNDFDEMKKILANMKNRIYSIEEHNKMIAYSIKYPNSANVAVYFLYLKNGTSKLEK